MALSKDVALHLIAHLVEEAAHFPHADEPTSGNLRTSINWALQLAFYISRNAPSMAEDLRNHYLSALAEKSGMTVEECERTVQEAADRILFGDACKLHG